MSRARHAGRGGATGAFSLALSVGPAAGLFFRDERHRDDREAPAAQGAAAIQGRRHGSRPLSRHRGHAFPRPGLRGHRDQAPGCGLPRDVHRPQAVLRRRRRALVPAPLAEDREDRGRPDRRREPRQALLLARESGKEGARQGQAVRGQAILGRCRRHPRGSFRRSSRGGSRGSRGAGRRAAEPDEQPEPEAVSEAEPSPPRRTGKRLLSFDRRIGARYVVGADEAGRGSLAGPLLVAGVLLDYECSAARGFVRSRC